jgi:hypothetical protein
MNIQKFTQKSVEAIQNCEKLAYEYGNQEIDQEHLIVSLVKLEDSLIKSLLEKMNIDINMFNADCEQALNRRTKVSGDVKLYISQPLNKVFISAEDEASQMGDSYVSVEHIFLALIKYANRAISDIFKKYRIDRNLFLQVLQTVRGNKNVTSDNPEATYDTLNKYGVDLVERAREQKLDPVIGRDSEIRNVIRILSRKTEPKFEDIVRIAVAMGVSLDALAGIVRIEDAEVEALRVALAEKEAELEAFRQEAQAKVDFLLAQIALRDQALAHKDKTIDGLMDLLRK